jgi:hypothetical protein
LRGATTLGRAPVADASMDDGLPLRGGSRIGATTLARFSPGRSARDIPDGASDCLPLNASAPKPG